MATYVERLKEALVAGHPKTGPYSGGSDPTLDERRINEINLPAEAPASEAERALRESGKWTAYHDRSEKKDANDEYENSGMHDLMTAFITKTEHINYRDDYWDFVLQQCVSEGSMGQVAADSLREWSDNRQSHAQREDLGMPTSDIIAFVWNL